MPEQIAKVAVENAAFSFDDAFDYAIPAPLMNRVRPGVRVLVPFGKGSSCRVSELIYLVIYIGILLDIGICGGHISLGLIVVIV